MKRPSSRHLLLAALLSGVAFTASAQTAGIAVQSTAPDTAHTDATTRDVRDNSCLRETGSLVTSAQNRSALRRARAQHDATAQVTCNGIGRAYTQDDLRSTGAVDISDALRRLDPSIH